MRCVFFRGLWCLFYFFHGLITAILHKPFLHRANNKSMFGLCIQQKHIWFVYTAKACLVRVYSNSMFLQIRKVFFSDAVKQVASTGYLLFLKELWMEKQYQSFNFQYWDAKYFRTPSCKWLKHISVVQLWASAKPFALANSWPWKNIIELCTDL